MNKTGKLVILLLIGGVLFAGITEAGQKKKKNSSPKVASTPVSQSKANYGKYDFKLITLDGNRVSLADYAGKVVLVSIWAPWCGPCRVETPGFVSMYEKYKDKGFVIIGVAVQTNETDVRSFVQQQKVSWPVGINDEITGKYATYGIPDNFLFKPDGTLLKHFIGFTNEETLKPLIEEALKEIPKNNLEKSASQ